MLQQASFPRRAALFVLLLSLTMTVPAGPAFDQGSALLLQNEPSRAVSYLEQAVREEPANVEAHMYLALVYEQLELYTEAISTLRRTFDIPGARDYVLYYNIGNNYTHQGDVQEAIAMYSQSIEANNGYPNPYLNRANLYVRSNQYPAAVADYNVYLNLAPNSPQREAIERAIALLQGTISRERTRAEQERLRQEEEERLRLEEQERQRQEEERRRQEEEARRRALLDSVMNSLRSASEDTRNLSAENEDIDAEVDEDLDIAD